MPDAGLPRVTRNLVFYNSNGGKMHTLPELSITNNCQKQFSRSALTRKMGISAPYCVVIQLPLSVEDLLDLSFCRKSFFQTWLTNSRLFVRPYSKISKA